MRGNAVTPGTNFGISLNHIGLTIQRRKVLQGNLNYSLMS